MGEIKLVMDSPQECLGGNKCRLKTNRYANGSIVIEIADFQIDTESAESMAKDLLKFKDFQLHIVELETALNQKPVEKKA